VDFICRPSYLPHLHRMNKVIAPNLSSIKEGEEKEEGRYWERGRKVVKEERIRHIEREERLKIPLLTEKDKERKLTQGKLRQKKGKSKARHWEKQIQSCNNKVREKNKKEKGEHER
jgi:hypothetical protein